MVEPLKEYVLHEVRFKYLFTIEAFCGSNRIYHVYYTTQDYYKVGSIGAVMFLWVRESYDFPGFKVVRVPMYICSLKVDPLPHKTNAYTKITKQVYISLHKAGIV